VTKLTLRLSALAISLALLTASFGAFTQSAAPSSHQKPVIAEGGGGPDPTCGDNGCIVALHSS